MAIIRGKELLIAIAVVVSIGAYLGSRRQQQSSNAALLQHNERLSLEQQRYANTTYPAQQNQRSLTDFLRQVNNVFEKREQEGKNLRKSDAETSLELQRTSGRFQGAVGGGGGRTHRVGGRGGRGNQNRGMGKGGKGKYNRPNAKSSTSSKAESSKSSQAIESSSKGGGRKSSKQTKSPEPSVNITEICRDYDFRGQTDTLLGDDDALVCDPTVIDAAKDLPNISIFLELLELAGLSEILELCPGPFTLVAPQNEAFELLDPAALEAIKQPEYFEALEKLMRYHIVPGMLPSAAPLRAVTLSGDPVLITPDKSMFNGATVLMGAIEACNGALFVLDLVLIPLEQGTLVSSLAATAFVIR